MTETKSDRIHPLGVPFWWHHDRPVGRTPDVMGRSDRRHFGHCRTVAFALSRQRVPVASWLRCRDHCRAAHDFAGKRCANFTDNFVQYTAHDRCRPCRLRHGRSCQASEFPDLFGTLDPSLAFIFYRLVLRRDTPIVGKSFHLPTRNDIDARVVPVRPSSAAAALWLSAPLLSSH